MALLSPEGPVYQAGTLSGNPLAMAAGLATLARLGEEAVYERLEDTSDALELGLREAAGDAPVTINRVGSMMTLFFHPGPVSDYAQARESDTERYAAYYRAALDGGVYLAPSQFECAFVSLKHTKRDVARVVEAARTFFATAA
jgi:glutamate-1-semialdehyde 2,1-aminomutase